MTIFTEHSAPAKQHGVREPLVRVPSGSGTKRLRTRAGLLNTAARLFADKGIDSTSVLDITKLANVSNGTFYAHFQNKEELVGSVGEILVKTVHDRLHILIDTILDPRLKAAAAVQWLIAVAGANSDVGSLMAQTLSAEGTFQYENLSRMRRDIARGVEEDAFVVDDIEPVSRLLNAVAVTSIRRAIAGDPLMSTQLLAAESQLRILGVPVDVARSTARDAYAAVVAHLHVAHDQVVTASKS